MVSRVQRVSAECGCYRNPMSTADVDAYIAAQRSPHRETLDEVRRRILDIVPEAEQVISYAIPGFRINGKVVAGIAAFAKHLSYFPHSGHIINAVPEAAAYDGNVGTLRFAVDEPLPATVIAALLAAKFRELEESGWSRHPAGA